MSNQIASQNILDVWKKFDDFPMETITKAWFLKYQPQVGQRTVAAMIEHRKKTGASGNCFDLTLWLLHEFKQAGITAYGVGEHLGTADAHVGVMALDQNDRRYLCDLGDLWIQPLCLDQFLHEPQSGYFTGARVEFQCDQNKLSLKYHRSNGKMSEQSYDLTPISLAQLKEAGEISQRSLSKPLVEMRLTENNEVIHWEFENGASFYSRMSGLEKEPACDSMKAWAQRISERTGMRSAYVLECLLPVW